jgi:hypothetical protein
MKTNLYIPKTITVGFQSRTDTFTGKLGYVIYTDHKGVLRKEASWNSWRDKKIDVVTVDNTPQPGFTLNKGIKRDGYWGSGRSVIRVWDPRDFEFEISVDNLIGILMHADVSKRDITEPCVFAWNGTELILLPTNSVEYQESVAHTEKQEKKFSARDLVAGYTYSVRKETKSVVYLGSFERYDIAQQYENDRYGYSKGVVHTKKPKKGHAFIDPVSKEVFIKDPAAFISNVEVEEVHPEFASLIDTYYSHAESQQPRGMTTCKSSSTYVHSVWGQLNETDFVRFDFVNGYSRGGSQFKVDKFARFDKDTNTVMLSHDGYNSGQSWYGQRNIPARYITGLEKQMESVVQLLAEVNEIRAEFFTNDETAPYNYEVQQQRSVAMLNALWERKRVGSLQYILADGKLAIDHNI